VGISIHPSPALRRALQFSILRIAQIVRLAASVALAAGAFAQGRTVAITVDDLPYAGDLAGALPAKVNAKLLAAFRRHHVPVTGFVIQKRVEEIGSVQGAAILKNWIEQGFDLGNHTYSHPDINDLSVEQIEEEIVRGEATFAPLMKEAGKKPEFFRFPYNHTGDTKAKHDATRSSLEGKPDQLAAFEHGIRKFDALFDKAIWNREMQQGSRRLSYEAFMAALFINLYRDEPILHIPYLILTALVDIDETLTMWRQRHALMAHRMLGRLTGTAGSGYDYLDETAKTYTPFRDLFDVATYLLPRPLLPRLPEALVSGLDFRNE